MSLQDETFTLGVEEEFQIIDPLTHELSPNMEDVVEYVVAQTAPGT